MRRTTIALLGASLIPAAAHAQTAPVVPVVPLAGTELDIVAQGESKRVPDIAMVTAGVVTQAPDAATALRDNAQRMDRVLAALKRAGVADRDIQTANISLDPQYHYGQNIPPTITGYQATNNVTVRFRDIGRAGAILDALVSTGANQINGPDLTLDDPEAAMDEARLDAMKKARARAELYARAAGLSVKRILQISESGELPRPVPIMTMRAMSAQSTPVTKIAAGEQSVNVTLSIRFELQ